MSKFAASPKPITCSGLTLYLMQNGQLSIGAVNGNFLTWSSVGPKHSAMDAMGYDPTSKYLDAMAVDSSKANFGHLIRLDALGDASDLGKVAGLPKRAWTGGDVDSGGNNFYVPDGGHDLWKITLSNRKAVKASYPSSLSIGGDFALLNGVLFTRGGDHFLDAVNLPTKMINRIALGGPIMTDRISAIWNAQSSLVLLDSKTWETWIFQTNTTFKVGTIGAGGPVDGAACF